MPASSASHTLSRSLSSPSAQATRRNTGADSGHPADTRMLAQQQVRLLPGMTRLLSRLLRSLLWQELSPAERRRVLLLLAHLEHDLDLLRHVTGTHRLNGAEGEDGTEP